MAKKKKTDNPESILEKAEKLFDKENYSLAKKEFEKANKFFQQDEIAQKIKACENEINQLKAKDLVKKGRKSVKKNNLQEALRCFEDAYEITREDWLRERIDELKKDLSGLNSFKDAEHAEISGQYEKAASLYEQAFTVQNNENILIKRACCLVKAEKYEDAASAFSELTLTEPKAIYDYGFALARIKKYYECLKTWDSMPKSSSLAANKDFQEQKTNIRALLAADICDRFSKFTGSRQSAVGSRQSAVSSQQSAVGSQQSAVGSRQSGVGSRQSAVSSRQSATIYQQGMYLINPTDQYNISGIVEYCKYAWIEQLWKEEQYEPLKEMLLPYPADMDSDTLALYAKAFFRLAEISEEYLPYFTVFLLTAVYDPKIFTGLSPQAEDRENIRREIIQKAEDLVNKYADTGTGLSKKTLRNWSIEKKLVQDIHELIGQKNDISNLVCTPQFAENFGKSEHILGLILDNRNFFSDTDHYLTTGAYYSRACKSLFHLHNREYEEALASLPADETNTEYDEFVEYCKERVYFGYGLYCLENGDTRFGRNFESVADLFEKSPQYEKELVEKAVNARETEKIQRYEIALSEIHSKRPTKPIKSALSLVMVRRCIDMHNDGKMNLKTSETTIMKALKIDPENDYAKITLEQTRVDIEMDELFKAIDKHKINRACQIAAKSEHDEVKQEFFEFIEHNVEHVEEMDADDNRKIFILNDLSKWCARVDESHPILYDIDMMLEELET